jgi:putative transposase
MYFHRHSIRLKKYDYSDGGCYFVTIDIQDKLGLFWNISNFDIKGRTHRSARTLNQENQIARTLNQENNLNDVGKMIEYWWNEIPNHFKNIEIDEYTIMPDHFHGIIIINNFVGADRCVRPMDTPKLGDIVQWFKIMTTNEYIKHVKSNNWPKFNGRLWQRNYWERIIRDGGELDRIRKYVLENPKKIKTS